MKLNTLPPKSFLLLCGLAFAACAPRMHPDIVQVESELSRIKSDPAVTQHAQLELSEAQQAVLRAEENWKKTKDNSEAKHLAYLAEKRIEIANYKAQKAMADSRAAQLNIDRKDALIDARTREAERASLKAEVLAETASTYQAQTEMQAETIRRLNSDLKSLEAKQTARGITLTLGDVLFATGRSELKPGAERKLSPLVSYLRDHPEERVTIEGPTDNVGTEEYNLDLSQRRADAVRNALIAESIAGERISARGLGKAFPVTSNESDAGRLQNRRVEIILSSAADSR